MARGGESGISVDSGWGDVTADTGDVLRGHTHTKAHGYAVLELDVVDNESMVENGSAGVGLWMNRQLPSTRTMFGC